MTIPTPNEPAHLRRPAGHVMRLARLGSLHQSRLSFMRQLTRRLAAERWTFERREWQVDARGVGHAVYVAQGPDRAYSLVAFAHDLPADQRSDRVIAEAWDATFTLFDGIPTAADVARLSENVPKQEAGRISETELTLARANRSVRLWAHVVEHLAAGRQPDPAELAKVGYLMRTTAVYGSGKFGAADREVIAHRPELTPPFQAEMLTVYLIRTFVRDLVNHMAVALGGAAAVPLADDLARALGIGNSTGLGMAPFIVSHPVLFNNWIEARETAIARVRALPNATDGDADIFRRALAGAQITVAQWRTESPYLAERVTDLARDLERLATRAADLTGPHPWDTLLSWSEAELGTEAQECLASLILEPYGPLVDDLCAGMADRGPQYHPIDGTMTAGEMVRDLDERYGWAIKTDWSDTSANARIWYVSEEKLEPRLGERFEEALDPYEEPLAPGRDAARLRGKLADVPADTPLADVLRDHPELRHIVRRVQTTARVAYGEILDNTVDAALLPIDMLRAKLSFFGATGFDPRSDRWVRICMFAGAPYPEQISPDTADLWVYPQPGATAA